VITERQSTADLLMVRPACFAANPQTLESNRFQHVGGDIGQLQATALEEFNALVTQLTQAHVRVHVFDDSIEPVKPDAIFPNNWFSTHADGSLVLYPMLAENRRLERRGDIVDALCNRGGFNVTRTIDLSACEKQGHYLEGTGSLVLDRINRIAYACRSPRTHPDVLSDFARQLGYESAVFEAVDTTGTPIYHTNVMMCVGTRLAVICSAAVREKERDAVLDLLRMTGHEVIELSQDQIAAFAGNMLELQNSDGQTLVALSASAANALDEEQRETLERFGGPLLIAPIPTIERYGGGSVRCMLAEICLPKAGDR
jgi:hypothetical protein